VKNSYDNTTTALFYNKKSRFNYKNIYLVGFVKGAILVWVLIHDDSFKMLKLDSKGCA